MALFRRACPLSILLLIIWRGAGVSQEMGAREIPELPGYSLVWNDEFDGDALDLSKWEAWDWGTPQNNELQYYTPEEVYLEDGFLVIRSRKRDYKGHQYTSGKVSILPEFAGTFGRLEIRAKLPTGQGIWPAFWVKGRDNWPPELDIMELLGDDPSTIYMTLFWRTFYRRVKFEQMSFTGPDFSEDFHIFAVEWTPFEVRWFIDGKERFNMTFHVPLEPMIVIFNTAVGGDWPGNPDETTEFPTYYFIDYFRYYKRIKAGYRGR